MRILTSMALAGTVPSNCGECIYYPDCPSSRGFSAAGATPTPTTLDLNVEDKVSVNVTAKQTNLKFPVPQFYDKDPELWFWQLEATFTVNKVTMERTSTRW